LAVTDWRLRRCRLWFLALLTATRLKTLFFLSSGLFHFSLFNENFEAFFGHEVVAP